MPKKRVIFDLDGTILSCNFPTVEESYFKSLYGENGVTLYNNIGTYLDEYELTHTRYDKELLACFLTYKSKLDVTLEVIDEWNRLILTLPDHLEDGVVDVIEFFKNKNYKISVLTNWFRDTQVPRLLRAGIIHYFDNIITGDMQLKPHKCAYFAAMQSNCPEECIMIGDGLEKDYIGPRSVGIESILYDKDDKHHPNIVKVKKLNELVNKY